MYSEFQLNKDKINDDFVLVAGAQEPTELIQKTNLYTSLQTAIADDDKIPSTPEDSLGIASLNALTRHNQHAHIATMLCIYLVHNMLHTFIHPVAKC